MKKLIFSEGGQPIYLDDLKAIQELPQALQEFAQSFMKFGYDEFILGKRVETTSGGTKVIEAHRIVTDGIVYDVERTEGSPSDSFAYRFVETDTDERTFADGQKRCCSKTYKAKLVRVGSSEYMQAYNAGEKLPLMSTVFGLDEVLQNVLEERWTDISAAITSKNITGVIKAYMITRWTSTKVKIELKCNSLGSTWPVKLFEYDQTILPKELRVSNIVPFVQSGTVGYLQFYAGICHLYYIGSVVPTAIDTTIVFEYDL